MLTKYFDGKTVLKAQIDASPSQDLSLVVVIPAINEIGLLDSLEALYNCQDAGRDVEVIVVINHSRGATRQIVETNQASLTLATDWSIQNSSDALRFHILYHPDLPVKKGGVGLARKIGMDEAVRRLLLVDNSEGIIACFDADCICEPNYLNTMVEYFGTHPGTESASIHFEHILEGLEKQTRDAIVHYELHLRYFIDAQRWARFPFAYQTVGSSMAVRGSSYIKVGGMNTRKAGEDFYFSHKVIEREAHVDLNTTTVFPSARSSDRVPFGTGKAITNLLEGASPTTYDPRSFQDLRIFIESVPELYSVSDPKIILDKLPRSIREFLALQAFNNILEEIISNTASQVSFEKRFFRWFNAFRLMKYVHFARDNFYPDVKVNFAVEWLLSELDIDSSGDLVDQLLALRKFDKAKRV